MAKRREFDEAQWLAAANPTRLHRHLRKKCKVSNLRGGMRRHRLYACGCCRLGWEAIGETERGIVEVVERVVDGAGTQAELQDAHQRAVAIHTDAIEVFNTGQAFPAKAQSRFYLAHTLIRLTSASRLAAGPAAYVADAIALTEQVIAKPIVDQARKALLAKFADLLRDVFHNPFRVLPAVEPGWLAWRDGTVGQMARVIYDERRWQEMPVLGDALEEAGCDAGELLDHCRSGKAHTRGCWAVDLILGVT